VRPATIIFVTHDVEEASCSVTGAVMGGRPPGIGEIIDIPLVGPHALDTTRGVPDRKRRIRAALRR